MYVPAVRIAGNSAWRSGDPSAENSCGTSRAGSRLEPAKSVMIRATVCPAGGRTVTVHGWSGPNHPLAGNRTESSAIAAAAGFMLAVVRCGGDEVNAAGTEPTPH